MKVDKRLLKLTDLMGIPVVLEDECLVKEVGPLGLYHWQNDCIVLFMNRIDDKKLNPLGRSPNDILAHEIIHATGHKNRLKRAIINDDPIKHLPEGLKQRMSDTEECIAELGSGLLGEFFGYDWKPLIKKSLDGKYDSKKILRNTEWVKEASETAVRFLNYRGYIREALGVKK